jgi:hypothetical protein
MCALEPAASGTDTASSRSAFGDTWSRALLRSRITEVRARSVTLLLAWLAVMYAWQQAARAARPLN